jgi:colanic acid biosynthesis protein WcaH
MELKRAAWLEPEDFATVIRLTPLISIDLIVHSPEGRVLLGRRKNEPAKNYLFVPGGRIGKGETIASAFERLTHDELGMTVSLHDASFLGVFEHFYETNRFEQPGFGTHYVVLAYELRVALDNASLPAEQHGEYVWLTPREILDSAEVHENTRAYFRLRGVAGGY